MIWYRYHFLNVFFKKLSILKNKVGIEAIKNTEIIDE